MRWTLLLHPHPLPLSQGEGSINTALHSVVENIVIMGQEEFLDDGLGYAAFDGVFGEGGEGHYARIANFEPPHQ